MTLRSFVVAAACTVALQPAARAEQPEFPGMEILTGVVADGGSSDYGYGLARRLGYAGYLGTRIAPALGSDSFAFVPFFGVDVAGGGLTATFAEVTNVLLAFKVEAGLGVKFMAGVPVTAIVGGFWGSDNTFLEFAGVSTSLGWSGLFGRLRSALGPVAVELGVSSGHASLQLVQLLAGFRLPVKPLNPGGLYVGAEVRRTFSLVSQTGGTFGVLLFGIGL